MDSQSSDIILLEQKAIQFDEAWNVHNAEELSRFFTEDADFLFPDGTLIEGRDAINKFYADRFKNMDPGIKHEVKLNSVRFVRPDVAVLNFEFQILDEKPAGSRQISAGRTTWVTMRSGGDWLITAVRVMVPTQPK